MVQKRNWIPRNKPKYLWVFRIFKDIFLFAITPIFTNIKINKCSSKSLTESRLYDVDIIPNYAGKKNTLIFLKNYFNISYSSIYVLGDSMNDYEMLAKTKNSFLVKNSSEEIIGRFKSLKQDDAYAILELIKKI